MKIKNIVLTALFAALIFIVTSFLRIPAVVILGAGGYIHLGDLFIFLACYYVGGWYAILAAIIGSTLADLIGYPAYALATLVIKGLMAAAVVLLCWKSKRKLIQIISFAIGGVVMIAGYFVYEVFILHLGYGAVAGLLSNGIQAVAGIALAIPIIILLDRARIFQPKGDLKQ